MMRSLALATATCAAFMIASVVASDDDGSAYPTEGPSDTLPRIAINFNLPYQATSGTPSPEKLLSNDTLCYQFRRAIAIAAGEDPEANAPFALIMSWTDDMTDTTTDYSVADSFNRYPEPALESRRRVLLSSLRGPEGKEAVAEVVVDTDTDVVEAGARRRLTRTAGYTATIWYMYGHDLMHISEAKDIDGNAVGATLAAGLADVNTWAEFMSTGSGLEIGLSATELSAMVVASSLEVTQPHLRYKPESFGDLEGTAVGSFIGVAVFFLGIFFVGIPTIVDKCKARFASGPSSKKT